MAEPSQAKPSQDPEQRPRERPGARGQQGGHRRLLCTKVAGTGQPLAFGSEGGREALGGSGAAGAAARGSLGTDVLAAVQREATRMIKGTERLISERRLKGLNIYIAWLRAVHGETN